MTKEEKIVMYDSPEAATYRTNIEGWVSIDGIFCGKGADGERMARYRSATHTKCECGAVIKTRSYISCESCRNKKSKEEYLKLPYREYDGSPVVEQDGDQYFFSEGEICDYLTENDLEDIDLLFCSENHWQPVDSDLWADVMPEEMDGLPKKLQDALDALNKVISEMPPASYSPAKIRTSYSLEKDETAL